jgi:acyl-coenzyme A thioesterase PaaI-like protein
MTEDARFDTDAMTAMVATTIPIMGAMGLRVVEVRRGYAAAEIPVEPNVNHFGSMYAGSLFTVAEMLGGVIGLTSFDLPGFIPVVKGLDIKFRRVAKTVVRSSASLSDDEITRIESEARATGKSEFILVAELTDETGEVVATSEGVYQMRSMIG